MDEEKLFSTLEAILKNLEEMNSSLKKMEKQVASEYTLGRLENFMRYGQQRLKMSFQSLFDN